MESLPVPAVPLRQQNRWPRRAAYLCAAVIACELVLRLAFGFGDPPLMQADPDIGYLFRANQNCRRFGNRIAVNGFHQRSASATALPDSGTHRILCVGDSVTWGGALTDQAETYPELLAAALRTERPGERWETLNASAGSWGLGNEAAYLRRFGTFGSTTVVLQVGSHDLLQKASTGENVGVSSDMPDRKPFCAITEAVGRYLLPRLSSAGAGPTGPPATGNDDAIQFRDNMRSFREIARLCRPPGPRLVVLHTPDRDEVVRVGGDYASGYDRYRLDFLDECRGLGVPVVNLVADWRAAGDPAAYFRDSTHLNARGNAAAAAALARAIR